MKVVIPTIEFKLNFLRPTGGEDILARGKVAHQGRKIALCQVDVWTKKEILLATGLFTYMIKHRDDEERLKVTSKAFGFDRWF